MLFLKHLGKLLSEFWDFARHHKEWWIIPIVVILLLMGLLIVIGQGSAPFIYTLF